MRNSNISPDPYIRRVACLAAALFVFATLAHAIDPDRAISQYVHERWGTERGFPSGSVYAIAQSSDGYLWIGTRTGLVRFDGMHFTLVRDSPALLDSGTVLGLTPDRDGNLWIRLEGSTLLRYRDGVFQLPANPSAPNPLITASNQTIQGDLLTSISDAGTKVFRGSRFEIAADSSALTDWTILAAAQTSDGSIWTGTTEGLYRLNKGQTASVAAGPPDLKVNCLLAEGNGSLWIGTDDGIFRWDGNKSITAGIPESFNHLQVLAILRDRDGNIWIGTDTGLLRLNERGVSSPDERDGRSHEAVTALFEDREGNLWIGRDGSLERLRDSAFVTYSRTEGLPTEGSNPVFVDSENRMWFPPVDGGLWWLKDGLHGHVTGDGLEHDVIYSVAGRNGEIWVGRGRGGLTQIRYGHGSFSFRSYTQVNGLAQNSVYSVYLARDGTVWAGTLSGGVSAIRGGKFTNYTVADGLASDTVASILQTSDGTMWFATPNGLSVMSNGNWRTYRSSDGLPSENVNCLFQDSAGVLWAGTASGLAFHTQQGFQVPRVSTGHLHAQILGIAEDRYGALWIATSNNVLRVNRERLLASTLTDDGVREYGLEDGLRGVQGVKRDRSVIADPAGRIWFSLEGGISVVDPGRLTRDSLPPIVHVETISADGSPIGNRGVIHVPGGRRRVTLGFTGLGLSVPEGVSFRYFLEGVDHGWSDPTTAREAPYTNLSPGPYRFRVMARNPNGIWSGHDAAIEFRVDPLFWQTLWFRAACVAAFLMLLWGLYRYRVRQMARIFNVRLEERVDERTRIARELHDTLLQSFQGSLIQMQAARNTFSRRPEQAGQTLDDAISMAEGAISESRDAIQGLRSQPASNADLAELLTVAGQDMANSDEANGSRVSFGVTVEGERRDLDPRLRDEAYRIARELLRNAFRHARARHIEAEIRYDDRQFRIRIRDDGKGIEPDTLKAGSSEGHWGLPGVRERAKRIGAQLTLWSGPGAGTEVELNIPSSVAYATARRTGRFHLFRKKGKS